MIIQKFQISQHTLSTLSQNVRMIKNALRTINEHIKGEEKYLLTW